MTDALVQFLRARYDEDEQAAQAAMTEGDVQDGRWFDDDDEEIIDDSAWRIAYTTAGPVRAHIARHDPARVLAEVDTKRQALDHYERIQQHTKDGVLDYVLAEGAVRAQIQYMALAYAGHPGYRQEWKP